MLADKAISVLSLSVLSDNQTRPSPTHFRSLFLQTSTIVYGHPKTLVQGVGAGVVLFLPPDLSGGNKTGGVIPNGVIICVFCTVGIVDGVAVGVGDAATNVKKAAGWG